MAKFVALLRGINVGGKNKIRMQELREALSDIGLDDVQTYIQSGNIVFNSEGKEPGLAKSISDSIKSRWKIDVPTIVCSARSWNSFVKQNAFLNMDLKFLALTVLAKPPKKSLSAAIQKNEKDFLPDQFKIVTNRIYLYFPNGFSKTKLTNNYFESKLETVATTRNWRTVLKLQEMLQ